MPAGLRGQFIITNSNNLPLWPLMGSLFGGTLLSMGWRQSEGFSPFGSPFDCFIGRWQRHLRLPRNHVQDGVETAFLYNFCVSTLRAFGPHGIRPFPVCGLPVLWPPINAALDLYIENVGILTYIHKRCQD
jgi:hypothetical protein